MWSYGAAMEWKGMMMCWNTTISHTFPLHYHANSGRPTTQWHTPDFFVLRRTSAGFEEWKRKELEKLAVTKRNRYQRDHTGIWRCPPGETYAEQVSLYYRLRSSAEYHPHYIQEM